MNSKESILKVLVYFDIFRYPLTRKEIESFLDTPFPKDELSDSLQDLLSSGRIFQLDEFYSLQKDMSLAEIRRKGNAYADFLVTKAKELAKLLYKFPYVRAIGLSGSVSKNFANEKSDIDYFLITKGNRLWIARTFLVFFRKNPFLKNRNKYYCMNYFIDEEDLVIREKNIYTATELFTLIPLAGNGSFKKFFEKNSWSYSYFPNRTLPIIKEEINFPDPWFKKLIEFLLNNRLGNWFDNYFFKLTTARWQKKEEKKKLNGKGERMGLTTNKHFSKPNPIFFHNAFIENYKQRIKEVEEKQLMSYVSD
ncbi:MAG TPA: nucleotidyltransferase domain-containing protein [Chitinophagaceae bacterium]|nr:nucleotidyltransferase domain-containing protein [Chitinophagaceae bacterium]